MKVDPVLADALLFLLAIWPATVLDLVLHEAGHAIAARAVGLTVLSFGVGYRKRLLRLPVGGAVFYVCWPISGGLQLSVRRSLDQPFDQPLKNFWVITAGWIANILGLVAGLLAWLLGWRSPLTAAWIAAFAFLVVFAVFPFPARSSGGVLMSDGRQLLRLVRRNRAAVRPSLGAWLAYNRSIIKLLERIGHPAGAALYRLDAATFEAGLSNFEQARRDLEAAANPGGPALPVAAQMQAVARLVVASEANDEEIPQLVEWARREFPSVVYVQCIADSVLADWRLQRGIPLAELGEALGLTAGNTERPSSSEVALTGFLADPTATPDVRCRQVLDEYPWMLAVKRAAMLAATAGHLARLGRLDEARQFRQEAAPRFCWRLPRSNRPKRGRPSRPIGPVGYRRFYPTSRLSAFRLRRLTQRSRKTGHSLWPHGSWGSSPCHSVWHASPKLCIRLKVGSFWASSSGAAAASCSRCSLRLGRPFGEKSKRESS